MAERMLITKLVRTGDRADLYGRGHQWKDLTLFDLSDLVDVGVDYANLEEGKDYPARFWALYELSEKMNQSGNPYKDVIALEPIDKPATSTSTDTSPLLEELRQIRQLLRLVADRLHVPDVDLDTGELDPEPEAEPEPEPLRATDLTYADGSAISDNAAELSAFTAHIKATGHMPVNVADLREWVIASTHATKK